MSKISQLIEDCQREKKDLQRRINEKQDARARALNAMQDEAAKEIKDEIDILFGQFQDAHKRLQALTEQEERGITSPGVISQATGRPKIPLAKSEFVAVERAVAQMKKQLAVVELALEDIRLRVFED